ncbi:hypothetical protein DIS24_g1205 [Lasiodiplodia hormozganensis]|uniref:F-box domain-containing protein n=1 Tax=Lasiodiplodia hormozganensis TaxID=869390 RepID=A0AA39Z3A3_9PEZI|nr:hypothetical protein DIS24_g1205 [Lasiodiplodia hormozganensis]
MNSLPHELLEIIVSHLWSDELAPFATISATFQELIERRTFRELEIRSTDIDQFVAIVTGSRRRILRLLDYCIALPAVAERQRNSLGFTKAIHDLFFALSRWDTGSRANPINLSISVVEDNTHSRIDYRRSILELTAPDSLPSVPLIHTLRPESDVCISDSSWVNIASRLPNLERLDVHLNHQRPGLDLDQRRHNRHNLAEALNNLNTSHLVHFTLFSPAIGWLRRSFRHTPNILLPDDDDDTTDHLSLALNRLLRRSPHLRTLDICGAVPLSPALFDVSSDEETTTAAATAASFPRLERVSICFAACAPDGTPYFLSAPATDIPDFVAAASLRPFVLAAARAAESMPRLRHFSLETQFRGCSIAYVAPGLPYPACEWLGEVDPFGKENLWLPRSYVDVRGLEGDEEVAEAWGGVREGGLVYWGPVTGSLVG